MKLYLCIELYFSVGQMDSDTEDHQQEFLKFEREESLNKKQKKHHKKHKHKSHFTEDELNLRRAKGSELAMDLYPGKSQNLFLGPFIKDVINFLRF